MPRPSRSEPSPSTGPSRLASGSWTIWPAVGEWRRSRSSSCAPGGSGCWSPTVSSGVPSKRSTTSSTGPTPKRGRPPTRWGGACSATTTPSPSWQRRTARTIRRPPGRPTCLPTPRPAPSPPRQPTSPRPRRRLSSPRSWPRGGRPSRRAPQVRSAAARGRVRRGQGLGDGRGPSAGGRHPGRGGNRAASPGGA